MFVSELSVGEFTPGDFQVEVISECLLDVDFYG